MRAVARRESIPPSSTTHGESLTIFSTTKSNNQEHIKSNGQEYGKSPKLLGRLDTTPCQQSHFDSNTTFPESFLSKDSIPPLSRETMAIASRESIGLAIKDSLPPITKEYVPGDEANGRPIYRPRLGLTSSPQLPVRLSSSTPRVVIPSTNSGEDRKKVSTPPPVIK